MSENQTIMLVDDNIANLKIGKNVLMEGYNVFTAPSAKKMFELLERNKPALILLDIDMPEMDGYEAIKILKADAEFQKIPVIFLTGKTDAESELTGLTLGAVDYISKPFSPALLRKRVELHLLMQAQQNILEMQQAELQKFNTSLQTMVDEKTKTVLDLQNAILKTMADLVEYRDYVTGSHIERVQFYLKILVESMLEKGIYQNLSRGWDIDLLLRSSQLHDIGKIGIADSILQKPSRLTEKEFDQMKQHTTLGVKVIKKIEKASASCDFLDYAKVFAGTHHEKWDGTGYPYGLEKETIPLPGRLLAIADVYDALTSKRPYKPPMLHAEAVELIAKEKGSHFDPMLIDLFLSLSGKFLKVRDAFQDDISRVTGTDL